MIDLHTHTIFSDGELIPSELVRRAESIGYRAIAITDHVDYSNYRFVLERLYGTVDILNENTSLTVIPGVEITHVPPVKIPELIQKCREAGAKLVVVHGETVVEPVEEGTNYYASISEDVDILAHPGFIDRETAENLKENDIFVEITSRRGHNITNGYVANIAREFGLKTLINTDTHAPEDLIDSEFAKKVGLGAGLTTKELEMTLLHYPKELLKRI